MESKREEAAVPHTLGCGGTELVAGDLNTAIKYFGVYLEYEHFFHYSTFYE